MTWSKMTRGNRRLVARPDCLRGGRASLRPAAAVAVAAAVCLAGGAWGEQPPGRRSADDPSRDEQPVDCDGATMVGAGETWGALDPGPGPECLPRRRPLHALLFPAGRHRGRGWPLQQESWLHRPLSAGWFMGMMQGGPLIDDWIGMHRGYFGGYRLGWDESHYWGGEMRLAFGSIPVYDTQRARDAQPSTALDRRRDADVVLWDVDFVYYPWGDSLWRPYFMLGLGTARVEFTDRLLTHRDKTVFGMPLALGLKYRYSDCLAVRFECADNIAFAGNSGLNTLHNVSITAGVEVRFGGSRKAYWPWHPGRHYW